MKKILVLLFILNIAFLQAVRAQEADFKDISFWQNFNDEKLVENIIKVFENNNDLKAAVLKTDEAQRITKISFANELPHIGFEGYVGRIFKSSDEIFGSVKIPDYTETHYYLPLTMNYEIDLWGQNHLRTKSKKKQFEAVKQDERAAHIYISSAFAADYYNLIRCDKLIEFQKELISLQKRVVSSYETKYEAGIATLSDIDEAKKNLTFMEEDLQKLLEKQDIFKNQIALLLADRAFEDIDRSDFDNLNVDLQAPEGIDFGILDKRPDRIKSELELERIGIDVKILKRDFLPKFIITGNLGFNFYNISSPHNFLADLGIVPVWDLFVGGRKFQMLKMKKTQYEIATQNYEKVILSSIKETNDALYCIKTAEKIKSIVSDRLNTDSKELNYAKIKQDAGVADNLDLLLQEERLLISKKQYVSSDINRIISAINLYQALGGADFSHPTNL